MMSINPDAHSTREIDLTHWGVEMARKGGVPAKRVLNCFTLPQLMQHCANAGRARPCGLILTRPKKDKADADAGKPEEDRGKGHGLGAARAS